MHFLSFYHGRVARGRGDNSRIGQSPWNACAKYATSAGLRSARYGARCGNARCRNARCGARGYIQVRTRYYLLSLWGL